MTWHDLIALTPQLILILGGTTLVLLSAWFREPRPVLAGGILVALLAALTAGLHVPPVSEIAGLFSAGPFARFFTIVWSLTAAIGLILASRYLIERNLPAGEYVSLVLFAATGMSLLSSATSLIGLFLGLEAFTLAFYILIACNRQCGFAAEAGLKYLVLGAVATGFLAFGIALIYAASGSFHLPEALHGLQAVGEMRTWGLLGWGMLLTAIGFKISLVPFHFWTPDVYQGAPAPVGALLATGSKGAVVAALVGLLMVSGPAWQDLHSLLWLMAALTMLVGALTALPQQNVKRLLAYSSVVHMGTVLVGLLCQSTAGQAASVFYIVAYVVASLGTFAVIVSFTGNAEEPQDLEQWRGLGHRYPVRCAVLAILLLSLAGLPATAGFMAKFAIFKAALQADLVGLVIIGILASLISFAFYLRVIMVMFMSDEPDTILHVGDPLEHTVLVVCTSAVLLLGLLPGPLFDLIAQIIP